MIDIITESGMDFIADNTYRIEKSAAYTNISNDGVCSVEFVRVKNDKLWFVEAKTSFPDPNNPSEENYQKFEEQVNEICDKFVHSLNLFSSIEIGVTEDVYPEYFLIPKRVSLIFILVIKNHELEWCKPIREKVSETLPPYLKKIWKPEVYVVNHKIAAEYELTTVDSVAEQLTVGVGYEQ